MQRTLFKAIMIVALLASLVGVTPVSAQPPAPDDEAMPRTSLDVLAKAGVRRVSVKPSDQPNPKEVWRIRERERLLAAGLTAEAAALDQVGEDRVLVILVEFGGTDVFTWSPGDTWDPIGQANPDDAVYDEDGNIIIGDCSNIITEEQTFTYTGPMHNEIPRPLSAEDRSGDTIWTEDFSPGWFYGFMFGDGVTFHYEREDGSMVHEDFTGMSVKDYFLDLSDGRYVIEGDVIGWLTLPHSVWWYGADRCPGRRSPYFVGSDGAIPGAGNSRTLVTDALDAVNAIKDTIPDFSWANYDKDGDGLIDRLWIVHAGYGEEDSTVLLNRTPYSESTIWSHSSSVSPVYPVDEGVAAGPYIVMPENGGIGVFAHEYAHNLGADDLYAYGEGETSPGFWALQADDWTGYPIGFQPPAPDPWHLDNWGWLNPFVINDTSQEYIVKVGQASRFPGGEGVYRGVKIELPDGVIQLPVQPIGNFQWWGGKQDLTNGMMTTKHPISIPEAGGTLEFDLAYDIEDEWDFLWIQASTDGETWVTLTNDETQCIHDPSWIGGLYGFPEDLCGAGIGGFYGWNAEFPDFGHQTFDLGAFAGQDVWLRFWYMTDWGTTYYGPYVDNVAVLSDGTALFSDDAEMGDDHWTYADPWGRNDGTQVYTHNFYLQWRNVSETGGYDSALGDTRWRFGPANTGLLVWYNNNYYTDNEIFNYLFDDPGFGPKGRMLVIDSHFMPYKDPWIVNFGYDNEAANVTSRSLMRDAPFSLNKPVDFTMKPPYVMEEANFAGRGVTSAFHDSMGYYPGAEFVSRGPGYSPPSYRWVTRDWDASAVVPATDFYGIRAPGYTANEQFRFACEPLLSGPNAGLLPCYWLGANTGLGYDGGTGNPGDLGVQYGWHVQVLEQTDTMATLKIWNSMQEVNAALVPHQPVVAPGGLVGYNFNLNQNLGSALSLFACAPIDTSKAEYVAGSATGGAWPLASDCPAVASALADGKTSLAQMAAAEGMTVRAIGWYQQVGTRGSARFSFRLLPKAGVSAVNQSMQLFDLNSMWRKTFTAPAVNIIAP